MAKIILEEFPKDLKLVKVVVQEIGGHGDCSISLPIVTKAVTKMTIDQQLFKMLCLQKHKCPSACNSLSEKCFSCLLLLPSLYNLFTDLLYLFYLIKLIS